MKEKTEFRIFYANYIKNEKVKYCIDRSILDPLLSIHLKHLWQVRLPSSWAWCHKLRTPGFRDTLPFFPARAELSLRLGFIKYTLFHSPCFTQTTWWRAVNEQYQKVRFRIEAKKSNLGSVRLENLLSDSLKFFRCMSTTSRLSGVFYWGLTTLQWWSSGTSSHQLAGSLYHPEQPKTLFSQNAQFALGKVLVIPSIIQNATQSGRFF